MALSETSKLAGTISTLKTEQDDIKENIAPDSSEALNSLQFSENIRITGNLTVTKRRMSNVYQVGHPTFGAIGSLGITAPISMPVEFPEGYPIGPWCILGHPEWAMLSDCLIADNADNYERTLLNTYTI